MDIPVKQLKQAGAVFAPVTIAEAVVVKHSTGVIRLDEVLKKKIEDINTPENSGLTITKNNNSQIVIKHVNEVTPVTTPQAMNIAIDSSGHVSGYVPTKALKVVVNGQEVINHNGNQDSSLSFGDDFEENAKNNIQIRWNNM